MTSPKNLNPSPAAPSKLETGLRKGLTSYGDKGFSLFLRKAFIKGAGYTDKALDRPVVGIANTGSAGNRTNTVRSQKHQVASNFLNAFAV